MFGKAVRLAGFIFSLATLGLAQSQQPTVSYSDDFQSYATPSNPPGWVDTSVGTPKPAASGLYKAWNDPLQGNKGPNVVYGTKQSSGKPEGNNPRIGTFSTLTTKSFAAKGRFEYRGRMIRTSSDSRIGLTFLSSYPEQDKYYLIGLWSKPSDPSRLTLQLFGFGAGTPTGTVDSDLSVDPNKWYQFLIQVDDAGNATKIRARFWLDGTTEPATFSIDAADTSATRLTTGRVGMWAAVKGDAYIDDLSAKSPVDFTGPVITFVDADTQRVLDPALLALFKTPARIEIRITDDLSTSTYTAKLDGTADYTSASPIAVDGLHEIKVHAVDAPGNTADATLKLLVDQKPPVVNLQIDGAPFANGAIFAKDITLSATIQDISTVTSVSNLDGNNISLPVPVADEKLHAISVTATDQVGWQTVAASSFIVDKTPPVIVIKANGTTMNGGESFVTDVVLTWAATDLTLDTVTATLDNAPFASGTTLSAGGLHTLTVVATDKAGHSKTETREFALDKTAPEVHLLANGAPFVQGTTFNKPVTFTVAVTSATPTTKAATIDDQSYTLGNAYGTEGPHTIKVVVTNSTGLSTTVGPYPFVIDLTRPTVGLTESGEPFRDGLKFARDVNPVVTAGDNLAAAPKRELFVDGNLYPLDTPISEEKVEHTISATATDDGGNTASVGPFRFMLDKTRPVVTIVEAVSGKAFTTDALFNRAVSVKITVADMTKTTLVATVDGAPLSVGPDGVSAPISGDRLHTVSAVATDEVGNSNEPVTATFTIDTTPPALTFTSHHDGDVVTTPQVVVSGGSDDAIAATVNDLPVSLDGVQKTFTSATLSLVEGKNVVTASGTDKAGNTGTASLALFLDTRAPEIAIGVPAIDACVDATSLTVSGSVTDPRVASVKVNDVAATIDAAKGTWTASVPVAEGKQLLTVVATDTVGHSSTLTRAVTVDRTAPVIEVRESGAPFTATLLNRMVSLLVRVADEDPNASFSAKLDGFPYAAGSTIGGEGSHSLVISATDCAGHRSDRTIAFTIDLTPPVIRTLNPANGATVGQTPNAINGTVDTDAARVEVVGTPHAATPNADGTFTIAAVPFAEGVNRFTLKAIDQAGNNSEVQYFVTVKTAAPVVAILEGGSPLLAGSLFNRPVTPEIQIDDAKATISATLNGAPFTSNTTVTADGNYTLSATATDTLGHTGRADTTFVIDRTPPVVKITSPVTGIVTSDHVEVRGTAGDAISATVNGIPVTLAADGSFVLPSLPLDLGTTPIVATGRDRAGNVGRDQVEVTLADLRPGIVVTYPPDHSLTNRPTTEVLGRTLSAPSDGQVTIGTTSVPVDPSGAFRLSGYALTEGENTITATTKNGNGTTNSATVHVTADFTPPALAILESGQPLADEARFATQAVLSLRATDNSGGTVTTELTIDGAKAVTLPITVTTTGGHSASAVARDAAGNESRVDRTFFIGTSTGGTGSGCALSGFDPADGAVVLSASTTLIGRSGGAIGVKVNGIAATVADGSFRATVELPNEGANLVTIVCTDGSGNPTGTPVTITLNRITGDPSISIATPDEGSSTANENITVTGTVGAGVVSADVNGSLAVIAGSDTNVSRPFTAVNVRLADGLNVLVAHGRNGAGRVATASRRVFLLKDAPAISVSSPISGTSTGSASIYVCGTWSNLDPSTIVITNLTSGVTFATPGVATSDTTGTFKAFGVTLVPGEQSLKVTGRNRLNVEASETIKVKLIAGAPSIVIMQPLDHAWFGAAAGDTFAVNGSFSAATGSTVEVNGAAATITGNAFTAIVPFATGAGGLTPVVARVTEPGGASAIATIVVTKLANAPKVIESFPAPNAVEVDSGALLLVLFSAPMDRATLAASGFRLEDAGGATVSGTLFLDKDVLTFAPAALLTRGSHYTIRVTTAAKDVAGTALQAEYVAGFTVGTSAPSQPPTLTPVAGAFCGQTINIKGTAPANARLQLESGSLTLPTTADAQGNFSFNYPLSGQSGWAIVRVRIAGSDGSLSPAAEVTFRVDCVGPQVLNATYDRSGANKIAIQFSEPIDAATATVAADGAIFMTLADGRVVAGSATVNGTNVTVTPAEDLFAKSFSLNVTTLIKDIVGNKLAAPYTQLFALGGGEQPPAGDGSGFISGEVYDATTGRPLAGASITIEVPTTAFSRKTTTQSLSLSVPQSLNPSVSQSLSISTTTDARGRYLVRLPEGAHTIRASMTGYTSVWRQIIVASGAGVIPIDVRLTKRGDTKSSTGASLTLTHGGETSITSKATLTIPGGVLVSGKSASLTAVGGQALTGLLPLGWSPIAAAEITADAAITSSQLAFTVPAADITAAAQNLTAVRYDDVRDTWQVITPVVNVASDGTASFAINATGAYALVYPDKAPGLVQPALPSAGASLQGVAAPATQAPLTARNFKLDPPIVLPNGRSVLTLNIEGLGGATFPSGTAVQAYIDEELKLADGSNLLDPPFATDLLLYRSLNGETGVSDFHLAPSPRAAQVILEVGFDHIRVVPYPGRLDRGTLVGAEGGRVPADDKVSIELPTGATPEPLRATAASLTQSDLDAVGAIAGFRVIGGFNITLQRATEPAPQDIDGDGKLDAVPPVELFRPARATFTVDGAKLPSTTSSLILAELLNDTPYAKMVRLASQMMPIDPVTAGASARFTTRAIDRSQLPVDGVIREGRYLLLAAEAPIAYATGSVHLGINGSLLANARVSANALGVADITRVTGIYNVPVVAAPAAPFALTPRHVATGDGATYTHNAAAVAESIVKVDLDLVPQPPALTAVTVFGGDNSSQLTLSDSAVTPNVSLTTSVRAAFSPSIDPASVDDESIVVVDTMSGTAVSGKATANGSTGVNWNLTPGERLKNGNRYAATVSSRIRGANGAPFGKTVTYGFSTPAVVTSGEVHSEKITITIPNTAGVSHVTGLAGALPAGWQAVVVRRNIDFITRYQATAIADGSFGFDVGNGGDASDRVKLSDLIDLQVVNSAGNVAAIIPLTPFVTADHRGFIAPSNIEVKFTSADGIGVTVPAGTFDTPTMVNVIATTPAAVADVPNLTEEVNYAASVRLDFEGEAHKRLEVELPVPAGADTTKNFILGYRGDSIRGPRIMAVETLRIANGKFTTTLDPSSGAMRVSVLGTNARAGSQQTLTGKDLKNYLLGVQRSGVYMALDIRVPAGGGVGWAVMDGLQTGYDIFWNTLASFYAAHFYLLEGHGRIVVPMIQGKPFTVVGVDASTGLQGFSKVYDPIPVGDPNVAVTIPSPQQNTGGPFPVFALPFRTEMLDLNAEEIDIEAIRNFKVRLENDQVTVKKGSEPLPDETKIELLNVSNGTFVAGTADQTLTLAAKLGHRIVLLVEQKEVDPSSVVTLTFNEPIYVTGSTEDEIDTFLKTQLKLESAIEPVAPANPVYSNITDQVRFTLDSGGRRLKVELPSSLKREAIYKLTLLKTIADRSGPSGGPGLTLGQGTEPDQNGNLQPVGGGKDLHLLFHVRKPGGKLASFDIAAGFVRDIALNGNVLLVTAMAGVDGTGGGLMAYDVADPASLNGLSGTPPQLLSKVYSATWTSYWAVASDPHGRVYVTTQGGVMGSLRAFRIEEMLAAGPNTLPAQTGGAVTNWALGYSSSIGLLSNTILSDRPESIPRKLQLLLQDDDVSYNGREAFKNATGATETGSYSGDIKKYTAKFDRNPNLAYLNQRVTVENLTLDMRWSADAKPGSQAVIENIIAGPNDRIKVSKNQRTYGVISHFGYGVGVYDLNAVESNDTPNRPSGYRELQEQIVLSAGKNQDSCFQPNTTVPKPSANAIPEIWLAAEAAIRSDATTPGEIKVYAPDPYRGLLDMRFTPNGVQNNPDAAITPSVCQQRAPEGLIFRASDPAANHPRVQALMNAFQSAANRQPFIHFISVANYSWRREAQDNAKGIRGSVANNAVQRDYVLVAGGDLGVLVVEVGGSPVPNIPGYPASYWPLQQQHLADVIWVPGGATAVRTIPRTNLAVIVDRAGRVLLADLSRLDERFKADGTAIPGTPLFATVAKCLTLPATDPDGVGAYDPRIIWKSEPGIIAGTLPPVVDGDTGMLYAGELLRKAMKVVAAIDPRIQMKVDLGDENGLNEVGGIVPLGIAPPKSITDKIDALPACTSGGTTRCKENASLGAFRLEITLPGAIVDALTQSNNELQVAVESERVFNAVTEQTPPGFARSHLRKTKRDGTPESPSRAATYFKLRRVIPDDPALNAVLRRQKGFNKYISPWVVAIADPRASAKYVWGNATEQDKKDAGCDYCRRPKFLDGLNESDGVYELWTNGRLLAVRPETVSNGGSIFDGTPYAYLGAENRMVTRFATVMADTVRPTDVLVAGQNPPVADGAIQETVFLHSGELLTAAVDLDAGGRAGFEVSIDRAYRSRTLGGTFLGQGWDSSMLRRLRALPTGDVELRDGGGEVWLFKTTPNGMYDSPKGLFLKLSRSGSGWILLDQQWRAVGFDELGRISYEADEFAENPTLIAAGTAKGNVIRYLYDHNGRLAQIVDPVGRATELKYWAESDVPGTPGAYAGLLKETKDWRDRTVQFEYDLFGRLEKAKNPEVAAASNVPTDYNFTGNNRPRSVYGYQQVTPPLTGNAAPLQAYNDYIEFIGNLKSIKDPAEAVATGGVARVTFEYPTTGFMRDRMTLQNWATGESASLFYLSATEAQSIDALGQSRKYVLTEKTQHDKRVHVSQETMLSVPVVEPDSLITPAAVDLAPASKELIAKFTYNDEGLHDVIEQPNGLKTTNTWVKASDPSPTGNRAPSAAPGMVLERSENDGPYLPLPEKTDVQYDQQSDSAKATPIKVGRQPAPDGQSQAQYNYRDAQSPSRDRKIVVTNEEGFKVETEFNDAGLPKRVAKIDSNGEVGQETNTIYFSGDATSPITRSRPFYIHTPQDQLKNIYLYETAATGGEKDEILDVVRQTHTDVETDSHGRQTHYLIKDGNGTILADESFGYNANGQLAYHSRKQKDVGTVVETYSYDKMGRQTSMTTTGANVNGSPSTLTAQTQYDLANLKITNFDPTSGGSGAREISTLDRLGRMSLHERTGTGSEIVKTRFGYDPGGNPSYETDGVRTAMLRRHDALNREIGSVTADGLLSEVKYNEWGNITETFARDSDGVVSGYTRNVYTTFGRLRASNEAIEWGGPARMSYLTWTNGDSKRGTRVGKVATVMANGFSPALPVRVDLRTFDPSGRLKEERAGASTGVFNDPTDAETYSLTTYGYLGHSPNVVTHGEPRAGATSTTITIYDGLGRPTEAATAGGTDSTQTGYDEAGNIVSYKPQGMSASTATFDSRGLATVRTHPSGGDVQYLYDDLGNVRSYRDESGATTTYTPDGLGRIVRVDYPDGTSEETRYEAGTGAVTAARDRAGQWLSFVYGLGGRVDAVHAGPDTTAPMVVKYQYDKAGHVTAVRNKDAGIEYAGFDLLGRASITRTYRYAGGSGLDDNPATLDVHTQQHVWSVFDGERDSWTMPAAGMSPLTNSGASSWLQTIEESHDAGANLILQQNAGSVVTLGMGRGLNRLSYRKRALGSTTLDTNYGYADGLPAPVTLPQSVATKSFAIRWAQSALNGKSIAGSANGRDAADRIERVNDLGVGNRVSQWSYDGRGRLYRSWLGMAGPVPQRPPIVDNLSQADFRNGRTVPPILSQSEHQALGAAALEIEPLTWSASENQAHQIGSKTSTLDGVPQTSRSYAFAGSRRTQDGTWTSTYDAFGRLASISSTTAGRKIEYVWDPNDRLVGRIAYKLLLTTWAVEDRAEVLVSDGLPARTTFVWDPFVDRLVSIFEEGKSMVGGGAESGLLRQYLHGDQDDDDPVKVLVADPAGGTGVKVYLPIIDEAGTGSLQAVVDGVTGNIVERVLYADSYGDEPRYLQGPVVDRLKFDVAKNGNGDVEKVSVRVHLAELIDESTINGGVRIAAVNSQNTVVYETNAIPSLEDPYTILIEIGPIEWNVLSNSGVALEVAVKRTLHATAWGNTPVSPPPDWAKQLYGSASSANAPLIVRQSFAQITSFIGSIASSETKWMNLYGMPDLYMAASSASATRLLTGFKAAPFVEPATGLAYFRARWYDPGTGMWTTPDPVGYEDTSALYAAFQGDPVNLQDPTGQWVETAWDLASLGLGIYQISQWDENTSTLTKVVDVVGVVVDTAAVVLPLIPGGVGAGLKAYRAANTAHHMYDTGRALHRGLDVAQGIDQAVNTVQAAKNIADDYDSGNVGWGTGLNALQFVIGMRSLQTRGVLGYQLDLSEAARGTTLSMNGLGGVRVKKRTLPHGVKIEAETAAMAADAAKFQGTSTKVVVPWLKRPKGAAKVVNFDSWSRLTREFIDRKLNVLGTKKFAWEIERQARVARQYGWKVRWEVPKSVLNRARKLVAKTLKERNLPQSLIRVVVKK